ncbi:4-hydroxyphenylpyruvate dioxygenase-like protein [Diadema antillarum]|uniref:4-hydroxyphenylpyruvate dioxygenase-like protein n=1 Tax=Diadema antillarum TaxID=105358 RepID=UPI003A8C4A55
MAARCVHHVQLAVRNGPRIVHKLISNVNFKLFAERRDVHRTDWVLRSGSSVLVVSEHVDETSSPVAPSPASSAGGFPEASSGGTGVNVRASTTGSRDHLCDRDSRPTHVAVGSTVSNVDERCNDGRGCDSRSIQSSMPTYRLGYVSPPLSSQNLDFNIPQNARGNIDTVCNVAFEVCDVEATVKRANSGGAQVLCQPTVIRDPHGYVEVAAVKSCVGNVVHTILNTKQYKGTFLPGFSSVTCNPNESDDVALNGSIYNVVDQDLTSSTEADSQTPVINDTEDARMKPLVTHFDHITFAVPTGASHEVLDWYENCFGMNRFWLDSEEDKLEGFVVRGSNVGLRMKAMEYWRCAETGLTFPEESSEERLGSDAKLMFVVAEALPDQGANQVETFIREHCGPGIQHIGLYTPNIEHTVQHLQSSGLQFMIPPPTYYTHVGKLQEILMTGHDPVLLERLGILLDAEDFQDEGADREKPLRYLMQVFTRPFFDRDTFFLEVIQRNGACGFGAGNIKALWKSVEAYMQEKT